MVRIFIPPHQHIIYIDEAWYMEAGKNMLQTGNQGFYPKSIGWPFILRIMFGIFGISNWVAIYSCTLLGALTVFNMFFLAFIITRNKQLSLISALLFSLFPAHIRWSATAKTNVPSLFFILLTLFFCFLYYKNKKNSLLWLALISLAFTNQFRPENYVFPILFLLGCIIYDKKFFKNINLKFILPWLVLIILSFANIIQLLDLYLPTDWMASDTQGKITGSNWSFHNLIYNSFHYGVYIFNSEFQPFIFSFFIFLGIIYMFFKQRKEELFLIIWFCLLWFVYFFSWFQTFGGTDISPKGRFLMSFYPITVIFICYGILLIKDLVSPLIKNSLIKRSILPLSAIVLIIFFIPYSIKASESYNSPSLKLETKIPELAEKDIPNNCVIIAHWPTVLKSTTNLNVIEIEKFLEEKELQKEILDNADCVLFFEDVFCSYHGDEYKGKCNNLKKNYDLEPYKSYTEENIKYTFYKIVQNPE
jgi:4-amino-4-deoxy-L-arabinose transferase-like glycosyltransferase